MPVQSQDPAINVQSFVSVSKKNTTFISLIFPSHFPQYISLTAVYLTIKMYIHLVLKRSVPALRTVC